MKRYKVEFKGFRKLGIDAQDEKMAEQWAKKQLEVWKKNFEFSIAEVAVKQPPTEIVMKVADNFLSAAEQIESIKTANATMRPLNHRGPVRFRSTFIVSVAAEAADALIEELRNNPIVESAQIKPKDEPAKVATPEKKEEKKEDKK